MTGSSTAAQDFSQHIPDVFVHDDFNEEVLVRLVDSQDADQKQNKCEPVVVVLDDLAYLAKNLGRLEVMRRIFFNGRHYKILLLLSLQYCKTFLPEYRDQVAFVFATFNKNPLRRRAIFETFNNVFETPHDFDRAMVKLTEDYRCMVLDHCNNESNEIADNVFWYKAAYPPRKWKLNKGGACWRFHENVYDKKYFLRPPPAIQTKTSKRKKATTTFTRV